MAIVVLVVGLYLLLKVAGLVFKFALLLLVLAAMYWLAAPYLGASTPF